MHAFYNFEENSLKGELEQVKEANSVCLFNLYSIPERSICNRQIRESKFANSGEEERTQSLEVNKVIPESSLYSGLGKPSILKKEIFL